VKTRELITRDAVVHCFIPGEPQAWQRHTYGKHTGRPIDTNANKAAKDLVRWEVKLAEPRIVPDRISRFGVYLIFRTKKRSVDIDNLAKLVLDACNDFVWNDDSQIDQLHIEVERGVDEPRTEFLAYRVT
jgi:Holliday junction resolvase RusA-like endonuclease